MAVKEARPNWSLTRLGDFFGINHTTVIYATDEKFRERSSTAAKARMQASRAKAAKK